MSSCVTTKECIKKQPKIRQNERACEEFRWSPLYQYFFGGVVDSCFFSVLTATFPVLYTSHYHHPTTSKHAIPDSTEHYTSSNSGANSVYVLRPQIIQHYTIPPSSYSIGKTSAVPILVAWIQCQSFSILDVYLVLFSELATGKITPPSFILLKPDLNTLCQVKRLLESLIQYQDRMRGTWKGMREKYIIFNIPRLRQDHMLPLFRELCLLYEAIWF